jgi:cell fate regulator YaaT (PSP1 superfamily)
MIELVKVRLREGGKVLDMNCNQLSLKSGDRVVVQTNDGLSMGTVVSKPQRVDEKYVKGQIRKVLRRATAKDEDCCIRNKELESRAFETCLRKIKQLKLVMKLVDVEYLFEGQKAIFYFTAEGRIDFRQLVRELANECRIRIEMRQIGVRDEAKMIGGFGICGRELCCSSFLNEFEPISIRMAKDQDLPLAPGKVSGVCGRLMCCLIYENRVYEEFKAGLPRIGERVRLREGPGRVRKYLIFENAFTVELESGEYVKVHKKDWHRGRRRSGDQRKGGDQRRKRKSSGGRLDKR